MALACGEWDVYALKEKMPVSLLTKWLDFYRLEPFGQEWENWLMARPTQLFASVHGKKGSRVSVKDFMYEDSESKRDREAEEFFLFMDGHEKKAD